MILKITGMILIVSATGIYGAVLASDMSRRLIELKELKRIIFLLKSETGYNAAPLKEALYNISGRTEEKYGNILKKIAESDETDVCSVWKNEWEKGLAGFHLSADEKKRIIELTDSMGLADAASQNAQLDLFAAELDSRMSELSEIIPKKSRVYRCVGIGCGIILAIILM